MILDKVLKVGSIDGHGTMEYFVEDDQAEKSNKWLFDKHRFNVCHKIE
ncbi:MAG TPA: hypothetical protein PKC30_00635 [Saprospiraceae bacterium]|nr:hypothetical protein [Saprospiraceae bacterium]